MTPNWEWRPASDTTSVLAVHGELDVAVGDKFVKAVEEVLAAADPPKSVEIDLGRVEFIDSSGLRALLQVQQAAPDVIRFGDLSPAVRRLLELTGTLDHFGSGEGSDPDG
ncbi:MAG: STAS domain-containing protein [Ilumatobacteraceae bacterium]